MNFSRDVRVGDSREHVTFYITRLEYHDWISVGYNEFG